MSDLPPASRFSSGDDRFKSFEVRLAEERAVAFKKIKDDFESGRGASVVKFSEHEIARVVIQEVKSKGYFVEQHLVRDLRYKNGIRARLATYTVFASMPYDQRIEEERRERERREKEEKSRIQQYDYDEKQRRLDEYKRQQEESQNKMGVGCVTIMILILLFTIFVDSTCLEFFGCIK